MKFLGLGFNKKEKLDPSVVIPLDQTKRHKSVEEKYQECQARRSEEQQCEGGVVGDHKDKKDGSESEGGVMRTSSMEYHPNTIEGLRAEVEKDMKKNGHDSTYESEFCTGSW